MPRCGREGVVNVAPHVKRLIRLLGEPVLLLAWPSGSKGLPKKWGHLIADEMRKPAYLAKLARGNIGVALGEKSGGLCSIDADSEDFLRAFDAANPALASTLHSYGNRGGNVWVRIAGDYPGHTKELKTRSGEHWGEFRSTGCQTIICGKHPSGCDYRDNGRPVVQVRFEEIVWPKEIASPPFLKRGELARCTEEPQETEATDETDALKSWAGLPPDQWFFSVHSVEEAVGVSLPDRVHENNAFLFKLARAVKALEMQQGRFTSLQLRDVFSRWYQQASELQVLRASQSKEDYMLEFLNGYRKAKYPLGSAVIQRAWTRAQETDPPQEAAQFENPQIRQLVALCRELQAEAGKEPFFLACRVVQRLFGHKSHTTAATWLGALVTLEILAIEAAGDTKNATRYRYRGGVGDHQTSIALPALLAQVHDLALRLRFPL